MSNPFLKLPTNRAANPCVHSTGYVPGLREQGAGWLLDGALTAHGQTVPVQVVIDRATNAGDGVRVHAYVERLDRYAFGVTKVKGFAGRYLDLDLDVFAGPA